jgi:hypothetical protein
VSVGALTVDEAIERQEKRTADQRAANQRALDAIYTATMQMGVEDLTPYGIARERYLRGNDPGDLQKMIDAVTLYD